MPRLPRPVVSALVRKGFREEQHPRDSHGRFIRTGDTVRAGAFSGTVVDLHAGDGKIKIRTPNGQTHLVKPSDVQQRTTTLSGMRPAIDEQRRALRIPPAWSDVLIHPEVSAADTNPAGVKILAVGRDGKGREQRVYSAAHTEAQAVAKFQRVRTLRAALEDGSFDRQLEEDAKHDDNAAALLLIRRLGLRPGSTADTGAEKQAYGATTLRAEHVDDSTDMPLLRFTGKKGVAIELPVGDETAGALVKQRKVAAAAGDGRLFPGASDVGVRDYLQARLPGFKPKDFRTLHGTGVALQAVQEVVPPPPADVKALRKLRLEVAKRVSRQLGNTPTVALQSYIDPTVFARVAPLGAVKTNEDFVAQAALLADHYEVSHYFPEPTGLPADPDPDDEELPTPVLASKAARRALLRKVFDTEKHPRGKDGRFIRIGSLVNVAGMGGTPKVMGFTHDGDVRVKDSKGAVTIVKPDQIKTATPHPPAFTEEAGARHAANLAPARRKWLQRIATDVVDAADPADPELPYWRGVLGASGNLPPAPKPSGGGGGGGGGVPKPKPGALFADLPIAQHEQEGTTRVKRKIAVTVNGEKVGEIRQIQHMEPVMNGSYITGYQSDFTAWYLHDPKTGRDTQSQSWKLSDIKQKALDRWVKQPTPTPPAAPSKPELKSVHDITSATELLTELSRAVKTSQDLSELDPHQRDTLPREKQRVRELPASRAELEIRPPYGSAEYGWHADPPTKTQYGGTATYTVRRVGETNTPPWARLMPVSSEPGSGWLLKRGDDGYSFRGRTAAEVVDNALRQPLGPETTHGPQPTSASQVVPRSAGSHIYGFQHRSRWVDPYGELHPVGQSGTFRFKRYSDSRTFYGKTAAAVIEKAVASPPPERKQRGGVEGSLPEGHRVGFAQELLYDMARGSSRVPLAQVKSDAEYRTEMQSSGELPSLDDFIKSQPLVVNGKIWYVGVDWSHDPAVKIRKTKYTTKAEVTLPANSSDEEIARARAIIFGDVGTSKIKQWQQDHPGGTIMDAVKDVKGLPYDFKYSTPTQLARPAKSARIVAAQKKYDTRVGSLIAKKRKKEGTQSIPFRDIPHWAHIEMQDQTWDDVNAQLESATPGSYVPTVHKHGMVEDGLLYHRREGKGAGTLRPGMEVNDNGLKVKLNKLTADGQWETTMTYPTGKTNDILMTATSVNDLFASARGGNVREHKGPAVTGGRVTLEADGPLVKKLEEAGAVRVPNSKNIDPGYSGSGHIYAGEMLALGIELRTNPDALEYGKRAAKATGGNLYAAPGTETASYRFTQESWDRVDQAKSMDELVQAVHNMEYEMKTTVPSGMSTVSFSWVPKGAIGAQQRNSLVQRVESEFKPRPLTDNSGKRVEYVPHAQPVQGAPSSQRGRLTLEGYTPEEAAAKLKELGVVGDLEEQVPLKSIMRSNRREGLVLPLRREYVAGDEELPKIHHLLTHGLTDRTGGKNLETMLRSILGGGGIHSIAERYRRGIRATTASPAGDIRSGIDHVVFTSHDSGGTVGSGASIRFGLKPEAMLRRSVVMAPRDFGASQSRYDQYKSYLNQLQRRAGEDPTSLYESPSAKVRQYHLNAKKASPGSAEFNIGGSVAVEDMAVIGVSDQKTKELVEKILQEEYKAGKITQMPPVVVGSGEFRKHVMLQTMPNE